MGDFISLGKVFELNASTDDGGLVEGDDVSVEIRQSPAQTFEIAVGESPIALRLGMELLLQLIALMMVVDGFDGLLEADGDEQAHADGGDVDEEIFPAMRGFVRRMYIEHKSSPRAVKAVQEKAYGQ